MKVTLISLFALFSSYATASSSLMIDCPEMEGVYECKAGSRYSLKAIAPTMSGYLIESDGIEMEYFFDNVVRDVPANENMKDGKVASRCEKGAFIVDFNASILYDGDVIAKQVSSTTYEIIKGQLQITQKVKMKGLPMPKLFFQCKKMAF